MNKNVITEPLIAATRQINNAFGNKEPWQIATISATAALTLVWFWNFMNHDESIYSRSKKRVFKLARCVPSIRNKIKSKMDEIEKDFEDATIKSTTGLEYYTEMPQKGMSHADVLATVDKYLELGSYKWKEGRVSGTVYNYDQKLIDLITSVYGKTSYTNPLHSDIFPGICKMEAEVVRMTATLFNGDDNACGTMTTGGTESIMMACKAYRDFGREKKGITHPNIVMPTTAHSGFDKAAQYLGLYIRTVPVNVDSTEVDIRQMEKAINRNTVMLVGSAPNFPYGTMDNIEAIAALGQKYNIPVHVDACLGGFVIIFMRKAGFSLRSFDFSVVGVTSISADPHKYGFAPKGCSVILYSDKKYRSHQYTVTTDWPGGVYGSPTVNGSRAGGIIAACWATLMSYGEEGYVANTKAMLETARYIETGLRKLKGIFVFGTPATTVIAIGSNDIDIFRLSDSLCKLGWNLNALQFPSGIHICVTFMHTKEGVADKFLNDVSAELGELMLNPTKPVEGKMAIYGVAQSLPDRSLVGDFTRFYIDSMYYTPKQTKPFKQTNKNK